MDFILNEAVEEDASHKLVFSDEESTSDGEFINDDDQEMYDEFINDRIILLKKSKKVRVFIEI